MANKNITDNNLRGSFCGRSENQVRRLIAGPNNAYICDECVEICASIVDDEIYGDEKKSASDEINLLKPKEIKEFFLYFLLVCANTRYVLSPFPLCTVAL